MCGLLGSIGYGVDINQGRQLISRRGPDYIGSWESNDGQVRLIHARLALVDPVPHSNQPMSNEDDAVTVSMVGEIYNYQGLRRANRNYNFKTQSDTEVVIAEYITGGGRAFNLLKGMYSLAIVDERSKKVTLARDPIGKKPLFYGFHRGGLVFGSSVVAISRILNLRGGPVADVMDYYWQHGFVPVDEEMVPGVYSVMPGKWLEFDWDGHLSESGNITIDSATVYQGEPVDEVDNTLSGLIRDSVTARLQDNPEPYLLFSGGIDSTIIAEEISSQMRLMGKERLKAISMRSLVPYTNDERYARFAAKRLDMEMRLVSPVGKSLPEDIQSAMQLQDGPLGMPSYYFMYSLIREASKHARIILSGDGGDEVFMGYARPSDWISDDMPGEAIQVGPDYPEWMSAWARRVAGETLLGHMLDKSDRASAEQGVEVRSPLLDWDLMAYARSLPFSVLSGDGRSKFLLKNRMKGWPDWFVNRRKSGFAYNLRWAWLLSNFEGMREMVSQDAIESMEDRVPAVLRKSPACWNRLDILGNFGEAWKLMAWSMFLMRLGNTKQGSVNT